MMNTTHHMRFLRLAEIQGLILLALVVGACSDKTTPEGRTDSTTGSPVGSDVEAHRAFANKLATAFSVGDTATLRALTAQDYIEHSPAPGQTPGADGFVESCMAFKSGFPDLNLNVEDIIVSGDLIAVRSRMSGTFSHDLGGMKPNGRKMDVEAIDIVRVKDGKQVEHWGQVDDMTMMTQLDWGSAAGDAPAAGGSTPRDDGKSVSDSAK